MLTEKCFHAQVKAVCQVGKILEPGSSRGRRSSLLSCVPHSKCSLPVLKVLYYLGSRICRFQISEPCKGFKVFLSLFGKPKPSTEPVLVLRATLLCLRMDAGKEPWHVRFAKAQAQLSSEKLGLHIQHILFITLTCLLTVHHTFRHSTCGWPTLHQPAPLGDGDIF